MLVTIARQPLPDAPCWPGRRMLAALDALAWPVAAVWLVVGVPFSTGVFGPVVVAAAGIGALRRLHVAVWLNHRYRFTTWAWAGRVVALLAVALALKLTL
jgi:hypothetical protein